MLTRWGNIDPAQIEEGLLAAATPTNVARLLGAGIVLLVGAGLILFPHAAPMPLFFLLLGCVLASVILFPWTALGLSVFSLILSPENFWVVELWVRDHFGTFETASLHKFLVLGAIGAAVLRHGVHLRFNAGIAALVVLTFMTFTVSSMLPTLTPFQIAKTFVGLAIPYMFFNLRFKREPLEGYLLGIALLPALSVILGLVFQWLEVRSAVLHLPWSVVWSEFTGAERLRGINIAAFLAFFSFISIFVSLYQALGRGKTGYFYIAGLSMVILILTGTRMPSACAILFGGLSLTFLSSSKIRASSRFGILTIGAVLVGLMLIVYWPSLEARFFGSNTGEVVNTSGRNLVWELVRQGIEVNPLFGRGLGAGAIFLLDYENTPRAAHNEYFRFIMDGGYIGLAVVILGIVFLVAQEWRPLTSDQRRIVFFMFLTFAIYSYTDNTLSAPPTVVLFFALAVMIAIGRYEAADRLAAARRQSDL